MYTLMYAGIGKRFIAAVVDWSLIYVFYLTGSLLLRDLVTIQFIFSLWMYVFVWLYFSVMESGPYQATVGKRLVGIIVTDLNRNSISFGRATGRFFGKIISSMLLCFGFIMALFSKQNQALHDMMAGCLVIDRPV